MKLAEVELRRVRMPLVTPFRTSFGTQAQIGDTLDESLNALFGGNSGTDTPDAGAGSGSGGSGSTGSGSSGSSGTGSATGNAALKAALQDAQDALDARQKAYADNDLVAAAQADKDLQAALEKAIAAGG